MGWSILLGRRPRRWACRGSRPTRATGGSIVGGPTDGSPADERNIIRRVFQFDTTPVLQGMVPRVLVEQLEEG